MITGEKLFELHDQEGFSLTDSLFQCVARGIRVAQWSGWFRRSRAGGWTFERAVKAVEDAVADTGYPRSVEEITREAWGEALITCQSRSHPAGRCPERYC